MFDDIPPPFGDITRCWSSLTDEGRVQEGIRLLGPCCLDRHGHHESRPLVDDGRCYARLVSLASSGDQMALGWLATTHRAVLLIRGHALYEHDPSEWGAVCLEGLHRAFVSVDLEAGRWLRRRMGQYLCRHVSRTVSRHMARRQCEVSTPPSAMRRAASIQVEPWADPQTELGVALDAALAGLDEATRDAFLALANREPLAGVADRHDLSCEAVRQRVTRARRLLQPELACFVRAVDQ